MSSKLQVAVLTGVIVGGAALLQNSVPGLANSAGLLYLRAEYKLATGDTAGAMRLMQQASAAPTREASAQPAQNRRPEAPSCSRTTSPKQIAATPKPSPKAVVVTVSRPALNTGRVERLALRVSDKWSLRHARLMADLRVHAAQRNAQIEETMRHLEAQLRNLPVPPPAAPVIPAFPTE